MLSSRVYHLAGDRIIIDNCLYVPFQNLLITFLHINACILIDEYEPVKYMKHTTN